MVQWLRLPTSNAGGAGLIPGWGAKILHAEQHGQKEKKQVKLKLNLDDLFKKTKSNKRHLWRHHLSVRTQLCSGMFFES